MSNDEIRDEVLHNADGHSNEQVNWCLDIIDQILDNNEEIINHLIQVREVLPYIKRENVHTDWQEAVDDVIANNLRLIDQIGGIVYR